MRCVNSDWPPTGCSDINVGEQSHSQRSHLHSVNQSPFFLVLAHFHLLGSMQPMTILHTCSILPQGMHSVSLTRKVRYLVSTPPETNHSKSSFNMQAYLSQQFWPSIFHSYFWVQYNRLTQNFSYQMPSLKMLWPCTHPTTNQSWSYWLNFWSHVQYNLKGWLVISS